MDARLTWALPWTSLVALNKGLLSELSFLICEMGTAMPLFGTVTGSNGMYVVLSNGCGLSRSLGF